MRCRPRPGSRFYRLDRLLCRRGCWEPLYDLITPPLRRGRNARRRSGIRHVLAPPPESLPQIRPLFFFFCPFLGWAHPPPRCLSRHSLDFTFFSSFYTSRKPHHPFSGPAQAIKWPTQDNPLRLLRVVYVSKEPSSPEPNETRRRSPYCHVAAPPTG